MRRFSCGAAVTPYQDSNITSYLHLENMQNARPDCDIRTWALHKFIALIALQKLL